MLERECCSPEVSGTSGVLHDSVLGPLLLLLYINDLPENIQSQFRLLQMILQYTSLLFNNLNDSKTLQSDLDTLQTWERTWDMKFNPAKCHLVLIQK